MDYKEKVIALLNSQELSKEQKEKLENIFPELKESEDERIRKELITHCRNIRCVTEEGAKSIAKWISWLEKQGEQKSIWHNEDEEPQRGSLILLIMQSGNPIVAKIIEPNHTFNHGERWAYIDDLLEKQGEQKPTDEEMKTLLQTEYEKGRADAIKYFKSPEESLGINSDEYNKIVDECIYGEQKPVEWSEDDEDRLNKLVWVLKQKKQLSELGISTGYSPEFWEETIMWLKSLKERVFPQPKQEWSEDDENV